VIRRRGAVALAALGMFASAALCADVVLHDRAGLEAALVGTRPCCVIDARAERNRREQPLADTVPYRKDLVLAGSGPALVVADSDARAVEIGKRLAAGANDHRVLAVKGGAATWRVLAAPDPTTSMPKSFVIPSNTCQQDKPLQSLPFRKP
jgi:hypothetical protein